MIKRGMAILMVAGLASVGQGAIVVESSANGISGWTSSPSAYSVTYNGSGIPDVEINVGTGGYWRVYATSAATEDIGTVRATAFSSNTTYTLSIGKGSVQPAPLTDAGCRHFRYFYSGRGRGIGAVPLKAVL